MEHGELRSYRGSRLVNEFVLWFFISQLQGHLQDRRAIVLHLLQARLLHQRQQHQVVMRLEKEDRTESDTSPVLVSTNVDDRTGQPVVDQAKQIPKTK